MTKSGPLRTEGVAALFRSRLCAGGEVTIFIIRGEREAGHGEICAARLLAPLKADNEAQYAGELSGGAHNSTEPRTRERAYGLLARKIA